MSVKLKKNKQTLFYDPNTNILLEVFNNVWHLALIGLIGGVVLIVLGIINNKKVFVISALVDAIVTGTNPLKKKNKTQKQKQKRKKKNQKLLLKKKTMTVTKNKTK